MTNLLTDCAWPFCLCEGTNCSARAAREALATPVFRVGQHWRTRDNRLATVTAISGGEYPISAGFWQTDASGREEYDCESFSPTGKWRAGAFSGLDLVELLKDEVSRPPLEVGQQWLRRDGQTATIDRVQSASARVKSGSHFYVVDLEGQYQERPTPDDLVRLQVVYVAGPMTGYPDLNFPAFHAKAAELRAKGYVVINPAELNGGADELTACANMTTAELAAHWQKCMRKDITALCACDGIAMLDGWTRSKGATLEHHVAKSLGLMVFEAGA